MDSGFAAREWVQTGCCGFLVPIGFLVPTRVLNSGSAGIRAFWVPTRLFNLGSREFLVLTRVLNSGLSIGYSSVPTGQLNWILELTGCLSIGLSWVVTSRWIWEWRLNRELGLIGHLRRESFVPTAQLSWVLGLNWQSELIGSRNKGFSWVPSGQLNWALGLTGRFNSGFN